MFRRILTLMRKEFILLWRDPKSRMLIVIPPILQLFIFAHAATMEIKNIHMAVLDKCQTLQSRQLIDKFEHSRWFKQIIYVDNEDELENLVKLRKVEIGMSLNTDFARNLLANKPTDVQIIVDGRQTNVAGITNGYASQIISEYEAENFPKRFQSIPRVNVEVRNWFNPNLLFIWYTTTSLITILATTVALLLTSLSIARERELGTFDQLIVSPLSSFEILVGKTIPPLVISILITSLMGILIQILFKVPFTGSIPLFYISIVLYLISVVGIGLFISSICRTQQQAILGAFTFQMPAILLSGYISPIRDMPVALQYITYLNPVRFFLVIVKGLFLKAMPAVDVYENLIPLICIGILTLSLAGWMFRRNLD